MTNLKILKKKFRSREIIFGSWVSYSDPSIAETFAMSGFDFVAIDMEHTCISNTEAKRIITACNASGISCLPRPTSESNDIMKPLLEAGSQGMLFPMVESENQFLKIVEQFKYYPVGKRSYGVNRGHGYGLKFDEYVKDWNAVGLLILQIESLKGVENLPKFLETGHVDAVMIGPYDMSGSLGVPGELTNPKLIKIEKKVIKICEKFGVSSITQISDVTKESVSDKLSLGYNGIILSSDLFILTEWARKAKLLMEAQNASFPE